MSEYILSCCSPVDIKEEYLQKNNVNYVSFKYYLNDKEYTDDFGKTLSAENFYKALVDGAEPRTSQINTEAYCEYFEQFLKEGKDILHICFSSGLSGTYNSCNIAKTILEEKYPDRKLVIIDSLAASSGYGILVMLAAEYKAQGKTLLEVAEYIESIKLKVHHWFFSTDLTFFVKGGRITKAAGWFGTMLKICPLLNVSFEGKLVPRFKVRTKPKVIEEIVKQMELYADKGLQYDGKCYISHAAVLDDATAVKDLVEQKFPNLKGKVEIFDIGTLIGCHTGVGTVALFFLGDKRAD